MEAVSDKWLSFKVGDEYLEDVWEEWEDDVDNASWTKQPSRAMRFRSLEGSQVAPKYMWDNKTGTAIKTAQEMRDKLGGDFVSIFMAQSWEEVASPPLRNSK